MFCSFFFRIRVLVRPSGRQFFLLFLEVGRTFSSNVSISFTSMTLNPFSLIGLLLSFKYSAWIIGLADVIGSVLDIGFGLLINLLINLLNCFPGMAMASDRFS